MEEMGKSYICDTVLNLYLAHAIHIPMFATDSSMNIEKVVRVVCSLDALKASVMWAIKRDREIRL
jgi:hypothetical protein